MPASAGGSSSSGAPSPSSNHSAAGSRPPKPRGPVPKRSSPVAHTPSSSLPTTLDPSLLRPGSELGGQASAEAGAAGLGAAALSSSSSSSSSSSAPSTSTAPDSSTNKASPTESKTTAPVSSISKSGQQPLTSRLHNLLKRAPAPQSMDFDSSSASNAVSASSPSGTSGSKTFSLGSGSGSSSSILSSFFSALANGGSSSSTNTDTSSSSEPTPGLGLSILADTNLDFDLSAESRRILASGALDALGSSELAEEGGAAGGGGSSPSSSTSTDEQTYMNLTTTLPASIEPSHLKKVKVYELRAEAWFDRGTGHVHGLYDEEKDRAMLVVTGEEVYNPSIDDERAEKAGEDGEGGGFLREEKEWGTVDVGAGGRKGRCLMMSFIQHRDVYQKQQDTLVVWTEPDGTDIALSFADPEDCENVWEFVLDVQKMLDSTRGDETVQIDDANYPLGGSSSPPPFGGDSPLPAFRAGKRERARPLLPVPKLGGMKDALVQVRSYSRTIVGKERLVEAIIKEDYLTAMIQTFEEAEELESLEDLHALCEMMRAFLFTNDPHVLEFILTERLFSGVVGMLEYDPEYPKLKASYRNVLAASSNYREAVPIGKEDVLNKVHQTYRLQFLKDVVLARSLEDSTLSIINSIIFFNQNDIISYIQSDTAFLKALFKDFGADGKAAAGKSETKGLAIKFRRAGEEEEEEEEDLVPSSVPNETLKVIASPYALAPPSEHLQSVDQFYQRRNVLLLLHQLLFMSKNIALTSRLQLVRTLIEHGLISVLKWAFSPAAALPLPASPPSPPTNPSDEEIGPSPPVLAALDPDQISNAAIEILTHALDHDPSAVRNVILKDDTAQKKAATVAGLSDSTTTTLTVEIIRLLVGKKEDGSRLTGLRTQLAEGLKQLLDTGEGDSAGTISRGPVKDGPIAEQFLTYCYDNCISTLMAPLTSLPEFKSLNGRPLFLSSDAAQLLFALTELLSFFVENHGHRSQYFVLSGTLNVRIGSLLSARDKRLRHAAIRFYRACLKINTHFVHRYLNKGDIFAPILVLLSQEASSENMLCSACLELFEHVRKENIKFILDGLMESHEDLVRKLAARPVLKICFEGLVSRWEQNHEPPPIVAAPEPKAVEDDLKRRSDRAEEDYFGGSDDESSAFTSSSTQLTGPPVRKRQRINPALATNKPPASVIFTPASGSKGLDLGYDDSDSDEDMKDVPATPASTASTSDVTDMDLDPADAIEDVARQMSEKRRREEEEEDGGFGRFVGTHLLNKPSTVGGHKRLGAISGGVDSLGKANGTSPPTSTTTDESTASAAAEEAAKPKPKLKFSLNSFKFGGAK